MELSKIVTDVKEILDDAETAYESGNEELCRINLVWIRRLIEDELPEKET